MNISQQQLKNRLRKVSPDLRLYTYPYSRPVNAIYYRGNLVCGIPKGTIYEFSEEGYTDGLGHRHKGIRDIANALVDKHAMPPSMKTKFISGELD